MINGRHVTIVNRVRAGTDPGGDPIWADSEEEVDDVLVQDGAQANASDSTRPDGITVDRTAHMPRTWRYHSLRGRRMRLDDGTEYTVVGDPRPYDAGLTPTKWNLTVNLHREEG